MSSTFLMQQILERRNLEKKTHALVNNTLGNTLTSKSEKSVKSVKVSLVSDSGHAGSGHNRVPRLGGHWEDILGNTGGQCSYEPLVTVSPRVPGTGPPEGAFATESIAAHSRPRHLVRNMRLSLRLFMRLRYYQNYQDLLEYYQIYQDLLEYYQIYQDLLEYTRILLGITRITSQCLVVLNCFSIITDQHVPRLS